MNLFWGCSWKPHSSVGSELVPGFSVQGTRLQYVLWGLWGCFAQAVWCVRQAKVVQMGAQVAVSSTKAEDGLLAV